MRFLIYQLAFSLTMLFGGSDAKSVDFSGKTQETRGNTLGWYPRISEVRKRLHAPTPSKPKMEMRIDTPSEKSSLLRFKPKLRFRRSTNGKWPTMPITWGMSPYPWNYPPAYLRHGLNDTLAQAFKVWAEVSAIKFQFKDKMPVDIEIGFNIDPSNPYGLAHAYPPNSKRYPGDIFISPNVRWTLSRAPWAYDRYLLSVAIHEIGHSVGLSHSRDYYSVMVFFYRHEPFPALSASDIRNIQSLYGKCYPKKITSFSESSNGIHILVDSNYWHFTDINGNRKRGYPVPAVKELPFNVTYPVDEILFVPSKPSSDFIFKGFNFWEYDRQIGKTVASGQISSAWDTITTVDAATHWQNSTFLFFKGVTVWVFDYSAKKVVQTNTTMSMFPALRNLRKIDTAFHWTGRGGDNNVYFFSGNQYWRTNPQDSVVLGPFTIGKNYKFENICEP